MNLAEIRHRTFGEGARGHRLNVHDDIDEDSETKHWDNVYGTILTYDATGNYTNGAISPPFNSPNGGMLNDITSLPQINFQDQRTGRKAFMYDIEIRGMIYWEHATSAADVRVPNIYIALVLDKFGQSASPVATPPPGNVIFQPFSLFQRLQPMAFTQPMTTKRFVVLDDYNITPTVGYYAGTSLGSIGKPGVNVPFKLYSTLNVPVEFLGTTASPLTCVRNALHLYGWHNSANHSTVNIEYISRVRYCDIE